jgi:hypothetical protein
MLRVCLVIKAGIDPVARQERVAEPDVPTFRQFDGFVELRQGDDASADQEISERAVRWRQCHGLVRPAAGSTAEYALQRQ